MTDTLIRHDEDVDLQRDNAAGHAAHIVKTNPGESAAAIITEARIFGTYVEALCGHRFIPQRDPRSLPLCDACKEIFEMYKMMYDGLGDPPEA